MDGLILGLPHYHYIYPVVKGGSDLERLGYPGFNMSLMGSLFQLGLSQAQDNGEVHRPSTKDQPLQEAHMAGSTMASPFYLGAKERGLGCDGLLKVASKGLRSGVWLESFLQILDEWYTLSI